MRVIQQRLTSYQCQTALEEENAIKEITQEVALLGLSRAGFFKYAAFQGGTALRIFYALQRFSEDLDFALLSPDSSFRLTSFLADLRREVEAYGYQLEAREISRDERAVQKVVLRAGAIGKSLDLIFPAFFPEARKIRIHIEVDTNPPSGGNYENKYRSFPLPYAATVFDLPSLFAGKLHALLCREYVKGRDWFDFLWYISGQAQVNYPLLSASINQFGPWSGAGIEVTRSWLLTELRERVGAINWDTAREDVARFLKPNARLSLDIWSKELFLSQLELIPAAPQTTPH